MDIKHITDDFSVSEQVGTADLDTLYQAGTRTLICNRPDREAEDQQSFHDIERHARELGMELVFLPVVHDTISTGDVEDFEQAWQASAKPAHAYCRSGLRSITLWSLMQIKQGASTEEMIAVATRHGFDFSKFKFRFASELAQFSDKPVSTAPASTYDIVIVGAGAGGISVASSLLRRKSGLKIALIDPADNHYYQPGFTMIGGGIFQPEQTRRNMNDLIPAAATWIKEPVSSFIPEDNIVILANNTRVAYQRLIVCPGLKLNWEGVPGLKETLGKNGVTSNYHPEYAAYTWELVQQLKSGKAIFTQPPMPIKCAGAPQKALYLSSDHWLKQGVLNDIEVHFYNAGGVLFGVKDYVPALQSYIDKYRAQVHYSHNLVKVDGNSKTAWFKVTNAEGDTSEISTRFDMLHVCPPQIAPDFIRASKLVDDAGWVDVDQTNLRHKKFSNIWALGDVSNTPNAKTAAAVRKQAPVVAANIIADINGQADNYVYEGYGSCPLTVERGKIVLAEFGYGGALQPTFPTWMLNGLKPTRRAWFLKATMLPPIYWNAMLKGREWLVKPRKKNG